MALVAVVAAVSAAFLAGTIVLMLRRWRNDVLFRHGQPGIRDVAMSRAVLLVMAALGAGLGLLGRRVETTIVLACSPALLFVVLSAGVAYQQSRTRLP